MKLWILMGAPLIGGFGVLAIIFATLETLALLSGKENLVYVVVFWILGMGLAIICIWGGYHQTYLRSLIKKIEELDDD